MKRRLSLPFLAMFAGIRIAADTNPEVDVLLETIRAKHDLPALAGSFVAEKALLA